MHSSYISVLKAFFLVGLLKQMIRTPSRTWVAIVVNGATELEDITEHNTHWPAALGLCSQNYKRKITKAYIERHIITVIETHSWCT